MAMVETGDGPLVVLLHGFPYDVRAYDGVAARLAGSCRVLVPYLRGYGPTRFLSAETLRSGQQAALAADLLAFLDASRHEPRSLPAPSPAPSAPSNAPTASNCA